MSQQSEMASRVYRCLGEGTISAAHLVRELRDKWGSEHGIGSVHGFVREVATCLLHYDDVEVGDVNEGRFISWELAPWDANHRFDSELMARGAFLEDENRYVFRRSSGDVTDR